MAWSQVKWSDVNASDLNLIADGTYTFELNAGAAYNERGGVNCSANVVSDGDFRGKRMLFSYPNPEEFDWAVPALKRLAVVTGNDLEDGEDPVDFLNRIAGAHFVAKVVNKDDKTGVKRSNLQTMSVKVAA